MFGIKVPQDWNYNSGYYFRKNERIVPEIERVEINGMAMYRALIHYRLGGSIRTNTIVQSPTSFENSMKFLKSKIQSILNSVSESKNYSLNTFK